MTPLPICYNTPMFRLRTNVQPTTDGRAVSMVAVLLAVVLLGGAVGREARAASPVGELEVITEPAGAAVHVNGEPMGVSPCHLSDVPIGTLEVRAEMQGWADATETVQLEAGQTVQVKLTLNRLTNVGSLGVMVEPEGARVWLDRVPAGRTPAVLLNVPAGTRRVEVRAHGFHTLQTVVTVMPNERFTVRNSLQPLEGTTPGTGAELDLDSLGELDPETVPLASQMPEENDFRDVRESLKERRYDEALARLGEMADDATMRNHAQRIALMRRITRLLRTVVSRAYDELRRAKGQQYVLTLRGGIQLSGKLVDVTDQDAVILSAGKEHRLRLRQVSAEQLARLASAESASDDGQVPLRLAALHAAEGDFEGAYAHLHRSAEAGADIAEVRSYVDAEHLWAAAVDKQSSQDRAGSTGHAAPARPDAGSQPVHVLMDTYRGGWLPEELRNALADRGFAIEPLSARFGTDAAARGDVLLIRDVGAGRPVPAYDTRELQCIMDWLRSGGGFVFFGIRRPPQAQGEGRPSTHPFAPLLRWFGTEPRPDRLFLSDDAPEGYPAEYALCAPVGKHPIAYNVRRVVLPMASPSLRIENPSWAIVRTSRLLGSRLAGEAAPGVVAARPFGEGRIVVFANVPVLTTAAATSSPLYWNDAQTLIINALCWASEGRRQRSASNAPR